MEMDIEKRNKRVEELMESRDLLFKSMIKYGAFNKCYNCLFEKIECQIKNAGYYLDE